MDDAYVALGDDASSCASGRPAGSTARTGSSTGARTTRRRSPTSRSSTWRSTTRSSTRAIRSPTATAAITIATVRPATILADVAVAVHPDDARYRDAIGREVVVPVVERRVPVIADERVEPEFGTGALKVTPGHDPIDFEIGRDHGLETLTVIGPDGRLTGRRLRRARRRPRPTRAIVAWLEERGQLEKREPYRHSVGTCERCHSRIEPLVSPQWWCRMDELARPAIEALRERRVRYHPESQHRFAIESLEQAPDWCVSRQLWWGHQIPIWTCPDGHRTCAWPPPEACAECGSGELERDPDVLDTWFSSALWPFATLGWPETTPELERYYPGDVNSTAREIIRLWENRMIFAGLFLLGEVPFTDVIIHSTVLARRRAADVEEPRHGRRPDGADRGARRRRDALRPAEDVLDAGRPLLRRRDRGGTQARDEALERRAADPPARRRASRPTRGRRRSRSAGSSLASTRPRDDVEDGVAALRLRGGDRRPLPPDVRRLLRLVRGGDQAAPLRRRRRRARDGARARSSCCSRSSTRSCRT